MNTAKKIEIESLPKGVMFFLGLTELKFCGRIPHFKCFSQNRGCYPNAGVTPQIVFL